MPEALINNPFTEKIKFHMDSKGKRVIGEIFELSGINLSENQYYRIAEVMKEDEIHQDVKDILDLIEDCLSPPQ